MDKRQDTSETKRIYQKTSNQEFVLRRQRAKISQAYRVLEWMRKKVK